MFYIKLFIRIFKLDFKLFSYLLKSTKLNKFHQLLITIENLINHIPIPEHLILQANTKFKNNPLNSKQNLKNNKNPSPDQITAKLHPSLLNPSLPHSYFPPTFSLIQSVPPHLPYLHTPQFHPFPLPLSHSSIIF